MPCGIPHDLARRAAPARARGAIGMRAVGVWGATTEKDRAAVTGMRIEDAIDQLELGLAARCEPGSRRSRLPTIGMVGGIRGPSECGRCSTRCRSHKHSEPGRRASPSHWLGSIPQTKGIGPPTEKRSHQADPTSLMQPSDVQRRRDPRRRPSRDRIHFAAVPRGHR